VDNLWNRALLEQNRRWLSAYVLSLIGDAHAAEDVVQDVFVIAMAKQSQYDGQHPLGAWLRGIARNRAHEHVRKSGKSPIVMDPDVIEQLDSAAEAHEGKAVDDEYEKQRLSALAICMQRLTERTREMLGLKYHENQRSRVIAEKLQMNITAVDMALSRARKLLSECIEQRLVEFRHES
jgi:RNA polymerase sigma-70 factor, ECF subfamily